MRRAENGKPMRLARARCFRLNGGRLIASRRLKRWCLFLSRSNASWANPTTVANALAESEIASEIYSTAGNYDLLVKFYVDNATDIGHFVNEKVQVLPGIQDTYTIITFKAFGSS